MSEEPNHKRLLALLRMTESDSDNEATVAIRAANRLLKGAGWDWEKLLSGKIRVIGDPWANAPQTAQQRQPQPQAPRPQAPRAQAPRPTPPPVYIDLNGTYWNTQAEADASDARIRAGNVRRAAHVATYMDLNGRFWNTQAEADAEDALIRRRKAAQAQAQAARPTPPSPTIASTRTNGHSGNCYCCGQFVGAGAGWIFKVTPNTPKWSVTCDPCNKSSAPLPPKAAKPRTPSFGSVDSIL